MVYSSLLGVRSAMAQAPAAATAMATATLPRSRYSLLLASVLTTSCLLIYTSNSSKLIIYDPAIQSNGKPIKIDHEKHHHSFIIKTEGCTIPAFKPLDPAIQQYVKYPQDAKHACQPKNRSLLKHNKTLVWVNPDVLDNYNFKEELNFSCCYQTFYRPNAVSDLTYFYLDRRVKYHRCKHFTESIEVGKKDEFARVICTYNKTEIYRKFYLFAPKKKYVPHDNSKEVPLNKTAYNVIVMGIDAVSRLNFYRTMPKTVSWLQQKGAIDLRGYNKVADNTFPNLIPLLLGVTTYELKKLCLPHKKATFDNCPFVWEWFRQAGYYTALGEDNASLGLFNYFRRGFIFTPVDYYLHTFISTAETQVGNHKHFDSKLCMQDEYYYKILLNYIEDLTSTLKSHKLFGFFWEITMSHNFLNHPMLMDDSYVETFRRLDESKYLKDTVLLIMSDHGIRYGDIRFTKQGRFEERLPFVFILTPPQFRQRYGHAYKSLKINSHRLTTPFDLHETLSDLVDLGNIENSRIDTRMNEPYASNRGISLFLPIPGNRTCSGAGIENHWCTCHAGHKINAQSEEAKEAGLQLVKKLNSLLKDFTQCTKLILDQIIEVNEMIEFTTQDKKSNHSEWREFLVVARTKPGGGVFEGTLRQDGSNWTLSGTASRLNLYGEQSHCIDSASLKLYCYCKNDTNPIR